MIYTIAFIVLIGVLVFVHELGHFLMGKLFKVRIDAFSIGFGKPLLHKKIGETDYRISAIPLGGYVKFFGDDEKDGPVAPELKHLTLNGQSVGKRALIVFGGPAFNFILAAFLFSLVFFIGEPNVDTVLSYVEPESIAWDSGLKPGDKILEVEGKSVNTWRDLEDSLAKHNGKVLLSVERGNETKNISVPLIDAMAKNKFGEIVYQNQILGVAPYKRSSLIGVETASFANKLGFKTGDLVKELDGEEIKSWDELEKSFLMISSGLRSDKPSSVNGINASDNILVKVLRDKEDINLILNKSDIKKLSYIKRTGSRTYSLGKISVRDNYYSFINRIGFFPSELFVSDFVTDKSPAIIAGMQKGDRIVAINGKILRGFQTLQQTVDNAGRTGEELNILIERGGKLFALNISPRLHDIKDNEMAQSEKRFLLGIQTHFIPGPTVKKDIVIRNPFKLIIEAVEKTLVWMWVTLLGLFKLVTGSVPLKAVGGPIMIGKVAGDSLHLGFVYFLRIMAIISINLGIINLFPVPVLDGGHLVFFAYEAIRGKPVKEKHMLIAQQVGFYMLIGLIFVAFYNDILRFGGAILGVFR
jgi:regulator of sigma E protease